MARSPAGVAHVELHQVSKHFGGVRALESVSVKIEAGSVHALVGENGAGKSTLGKIIGGVIAPDEGTLLLRGDPVRFRSPREALEHGVATIAQELAIVPELSAAANVFLGVEPRAAGVVRRRELRRRYRDLCDFVGFGVPADAPAGHLRTADQQKLEILRAIARDAELIVLDEPSAALSRDEVERLHEAIAALRDRGRTVVLVSHFLNEVLAVSDHVTVLRDGRVVRSGPTAEESEPSLIEAMLGRALEQTFPDKQPPPADAPIVLAVERLRAPGVDGVSFDLRAGEILALSGLVGAGRTEVARAIVGIGHPTSGAVRLGGEALGRRSPRRLLRAGLAMIPESRKDQGLVLERSVRENTVLSIVPALARLGYLRRGVERRRVADALLRVDVRAASTAMPVGALSGGNQQKLLFARAFLSDPRVLVADEPTRGVDVGARRSIYDLLVAYAREGRGVLLISSDIEEVLGLAHRILVMRAGRVVASFDGTTATEHEVVGAALRNEEGAA